MTRDYLNTTPFDRLLALRGDDLHVAAGPSITVQPIDRPHTFATFTGTPGNDVLFGTNGQDAISGLAGDDELHGLGAKDHVYGNGGDDMLLGEKGKDHLFGGNGDDFLEGDIVGQNISKADHLKGGLGADTYEFTAINSSSLYHDEAIGVDFSTDKIHLVDTAGATFLPTSTSSTVGGALDVSSFDGDLGLLTLAIGEATIFEPNAGSEAGKYYLVVNMDGVTGYQANTDCVVELTNIQSLGSYNTSAFI